MVKRKTKLIKKKEEEIETDFVGQNYELDVMFQLYYSVLICINFV